MKKIIWIIIILLIILGIVTFVGGKDEFVSDEPIKIGALLILSGEGAAWGENAQKGIMMAVNEFNESSENRKVEVIFEDTGGENKKAVSGYRKLINIDKVDAIIGPLFQSEVASISPLVDQDNIPVVTPSYAPIKNRLNPRNPLMIWMDPSTEASRMAEYVFNQNIRSVSVIGTLDSWENEVSEAFAEKFKSLGGTVVFKEIVQPDTSDIRLTVTKALNKKPEAIFIGSYYQFIPVTRIINELGFAGDVFSIEIDSYLASETAPFSDGLRFISPKFYTDEFIEEFEMNYEHKPGIPAGQAYDAMNILMNFLNDNDIDKVLVAMDEFKEYDGVSGKIVITEDNKTLFDTAIFELQNGEAVVVE